VGRVNREVFGGGLVHYIMCTMSREEAMYLICLECEEPLL